MNAFKQLLLPFGHSINELRNVKYGDNFVTLDNRRFDVVD